MQNSIRKHHMELLQIHNTGAEEWWCPTCERRFIIQWPPNYQKIILETGDEYAFHSCNKGEQKQSDNHKKIYLSPELMEALDEFLDELEMNN